MRDSAFKMIGRGIVSADKKVGSVYIDVIPIELTFVKPTTIKSTVETTEYSYDTGNGTAYIKIDRTNTIKNARWLRETNRMTPPDVRAKDEVLIWQLGDTDIFYWEDLDSNNNKRLEHVVYKYAADPDNQTNAQLTNAYIQVISTLAGHYTIRTSKANGEPYVYKFQINAKDGIVITEDDVGNRTFIDSVNAFIGSENSYGTEINIKGEDFNVKGEGIGVIKLDKKVNIETLEVNVNCKNATITADESATLKTNNYTVDSPISTFTGLIKCAGLGAGDEAPEAGNVAVSGNMKAKHVDSNTIKATSIDATTVNAPNGKVGS